MSCKFADLLFMLVEVATLDQIAVRVMRAFVFIFLDYLSIVFDFG